MPRIYSLPDIEKVNCSSQINKFRQEIDKQFKILPQHQLYIQVPTDQISSLLFLVFGNYKQLEENPEFTKLNKRNKQKIHDVFRKIQSLDKQDGEFINQIRLNFETIHVNQFILKSIKDILNKITPKILSKSLNHVYLGLSEYDPLWQSPNLAEINKKSLIVPFKNQDKVILGIYETIKSFSIEQINLIWKDLQKNQQFLCQKQTKPQNMSNKKTQNKKKQKVQKEKQKKIDQKIEIPLVREVQKPFHQDSVSLFFIALILILSTLILSTIINPSLKNEVRFEQKSLGQIQMQVLKWNYQIQKFTGPLKQKVYQIYLENISPHCKEYFINPLQDLSIYLQLLLPQVKNFIVDVTQASQSNKEHYKQNQKSSIKK